MRMQPMPFAGGRLGEARGMANVTGNPWVDVGLGVARAAAGIIQGNQTKQKNKGIISAAYRTGRQRLDLTQQDTRQNVAEGAVARGLAGGGGVRMGPPVHPIGGAGVGGEGYKTADTLWTPPGYPKGVPIGNVGMMRYQKQVGGELPAGPVSVSGAYDLGSQQGADLSREQQLAQTELVRQKDAALSSNNADYANTIASSLGAGVDTAMSLNTAGGPKTPSVSGAFGGGPMPTGTTAPDSPRAPGGAAMSASPYANAWGNIDPVAPLTRGAWAQGTNADFNAYNG